MEEIYEIPQHVKAYWNPEIQATVQIWKDMNVGLEEYKKMMYFLLKKSQLENTKRWLSDASKAPNDLPKECLDWIKEEFAIDFLLSSVEYIASVIPPQRDLSPESWQRRGDSLLVIKNVHTFEEGKKWLLEQPQN